MIGVNSVDAAVGHFHLQNELVVAQDHVLADLKRKHGLELVLFRLELGDASASEVDGCVRFLQNLVLNLPRVKLVVATIKLVQLLREVVRRILHVDVQVVLLFRVNLEVDNEAVLFARSQLWQLDLHESLRLLSPLIIFLVSLVFGHLLQNGLDLEVFDGVSRVLILNREQNAELLAHADFTKRRVEVERGMTRNVIVAYIATRQQLFQLSVVTNDLEAALIGAEAGCERVSAGTTSLFNIFVAQIELLLIKVLLVVVLELGARQSLY